MPIKHHITSAPVIAGGKPTSSLANSYLAHKADPHSKIKLDAFGDELDCLLQQFLRDGSQTGCLHQKEADIRQSAAQVLLRDYLDGNARLQVGVRSRAIGTVENEIKRSTNAVLGIITKRMIRKSKMEQQALEKFALSAAQPDVGCRYLSTRRKIAALLQAALKQRTISARSAKVLTSLIIDEQSRNEVAEQYGITPHAIAQIVRRAKTVLARMEPSIDM